MKKLKLVSIIASLFLLVSCNNEIRIEYDYEINLDNGRATVVAHAVETSKNIVIDSFHYFISYIGSSYDINVPNTLPFYSNLDNKEYIWPVVGIGAGTGSPLFYPFYILFEVPGLEKRSITLNVNIGSHMENIAMSNVDTYNFFSGSTDESSVVDVTYSVFYNVAEDNKTYMSDEDGYIYKIDENGNKGNRIPIDYGTREEESN